MHHHLYVACIYTYAHTGISGFKDLQLQQNLVDVWAEIFQSCQWLWVLIRPNSLGHIFSCSEKTQLQVKPVYGVADEAFKHSSFLGSEKLRKPKLEGIFFFFLNLASKDSRCLVLIYLNRIHSMVFLLIFNAILQWNVLP